MSDELFITRAADEKGKFTVVEVLQSADSDKVRFCARGGGFVQVMPTEQFKTTFQSHDASQDQFKPSHVQTDWLESDVAIECYSDGQRWNGWAMPHFTRDNGLTLSQHMPGLEYNAGRDVFEIWEDDELHTYAAQTIIVDDAPVRVYMIGAGQWCWDEVQQPTHSERPKD